MFFSKKTDREVPATQSPPEVRPENLRWKQGSRRSQSFQIAAQSWSFTFKPSLRIQNGGKVDATFEGIAYLGTTPNVPVYGEIEIRDEIETPRFLEDRWKTLPESVEGYASLSTADDPGMPDKLYITLYCTPVAFDWVSRLFGSGFCSGGTIALNIDIGYPDEKGDDFWMDRWRQETLQVLNWDVRTYAKR